VTIPEHAPLEGGLSLTTSERLMLSVVRAAREARAATPELREAVRAYVRELKDRGHPPERVLVAVKALVAEAGFTRTGPWADRSSTSIHPETEVLDRLVAWCIEEYFPPAPTAD
jgi:hypothetical protein